MTHLRIAMASFGHEANTFSPHITTMTDFEQRWLVEGEALLSTTRGTNSCEAGAASVLEDCEDCEIVPLMGARALSGAPLDALSYAELERDLLARLRAALPVDGVLLVLHGAMMCEDDPDATGAVLAAVRAVVGPDVPVVGTLDLHANVTERMVREATALVGYHTAPHVDMFQTGQSAARILLATAEGRARPTPALVRLPMIVPPENARHTDGPLSEVIGRVLEMERRGEILHGAVYPVQPWMDTPDLASSVVIITDGDRAAAQRQARAVAEAFWARRAAFVPQYVSAEDAVRRALAREDGTVIFCDSADSTTSGSTGDSTEVLQALLAHGPLSGVDALLNIVDAGAVAAAIEAGVGQRVTVQVGGAIAPEWYQPVTFTGTVRLISDGEFRFKGPGQRGVVHHMGRTAVLVEGGLHLVVMERPVSQWDPQLYRSQGLEPADARIVQVKSPAAFRAAYEGIMDEVLVIGYRGIASSDFCRLPWERVGRPLYPLDPNTSWEPR